LKGGEGGEESKQEKAEERQGRHGVATCKVVMVVVRGGMHTIMVVTTDEMREMGGTVVR
jgi:hypothetical protein